MRSIGDIRFLVLRRRYELGTRVEDDVAGCKALLSAIAVRVDADDSDAPLAGSLTWLAGASCRPSVSAGLLGFNSALAVFSVF